MYLCKIPVRNFKSVEVEVLQAEIMCLSGTSGF